MSRVNRTLGRAWAALLWGLILTGPNPAAAAQMLSQAAYERVVKVQGVLETGDYPKARDVAQSALAKKSSVGYERALVLQMLSHSLAGLDDYPGAAAALEAVLLLDVFDPPQVRASQFNLARLYVAAGELDRGLRILEGWFRDAEAPGPDAYMLLAQIHAQNTAYSKALGPAQEAVRLSDSPREDWYRFLSALHYELGDVDAMAGVLRSMVVFWPTQTRYWNRLAWSYESLERHDDARAVLELADKQDLLIEESQFLHLARLYLQAGVPSRAARVVRTGLDNGNIKRSAKNWTLLADALLQSEDRVASIQALEEAVKQSTGRDLHARLARTYLSDEDWPAAIRVAQSGLEKGDPDRLADLSLILGIARYRRGEVEAARAAFEVAARDPEAREGAEQWLVLMPELQKTVP